MPREDPNPKNYSFGDSIGVLGLLVGMYVALVVPSVIFKALLLGLVAVAIVCLVPKFYWARNWNTAYQRGAAFFVAVVLCAIGIPQLISQWRSEHPHWKDINHGTRFVAQLLPTDSSKKDSPALEAVLTLENNDSSSMDHHVYFGLLSSQAFSSVVIDNPARVQRVQGGPDTRAPFVSNILELNAPELDVGERQMITIKFAKPVKPAEVAVRMQSDNCPRECNNVAIIPPYFVTFDQPPPTANQSATIPSRAEKR